MNAPPAVRPVALVTGGAMRIGRAIVERLAEDGYGVAIHYRQSRESAEALAATLIARGGTAVPVGGDLADAAAPTAILSAAEAALGPVTLLVNNASVFEDDSALAFDPARWEAHFAVNLRAPVALASEMARRLPDEAEGAIVNIIDQRVWKPTPRFFSYTLTKSALLTATMTMAQAFAPKIRVNAVGPGPTLANERQDAAAFVRQSAAVPLGHGGSPEEIADAVSFLARARSITGQMIAVDGGQHLAWETPDVTGQE